MKNQKNDQVKLRNVKRATICLMFAMFFLPFGYDALFALIMKWTGSYWKADLVFYFISALFFGLYFYFSGNKPLKAIKDIIKSIYEDKIKHYYLKIKNKGY